MNNTLKIAPEMASGILAATKAIDILKFIVEHREDEPHVCLERFKSLAKEDQTPVLCELMISTTLDAFEFIGEQTDYLCGRAMATYGSEAFKLIKEPSDVNRRDFIRLLKRSNLKDIRILGELSEGEQIAFFNTSPESIAQYDPKFLTMGICRTAVITDPRTFISIPKQFKTKELTELAIQKDASNIMAMRSEDQTDWLKSMAINSEKNGESCLIYFGTATTAKRLECLEKFPNAIKTIPDSTLEEQMFVVKQNTNAFEHIPNPKDEVIIHCIAKYPHLFYYVKRASLAVIQFILASNQPSKYLDYIKEVTPETAEAIINYDVKYICDAPSDILTPELVEEILDINPHNIQYIKEPTVDNYIQAYDGLVVLETDASIINSLVLERAALKGVFDGLI